MLFNFPKNIFMSNIENKKYFGVRLITFLAATGVSGLTKTLLDELFIHLEFNADIFILVAIITHWLVFLIFITFTSRFINRTDDLLKIAISLLGIYFVVQGGQFYHTIEIEN